MKFHPDEEYEVVPVIPTNGTHTDEYPFCMDMSCHCHADGNEQTEITTGQYTDGLMTGSEVDRYYRGRVI